MIIGKLTKRDLNRLKDYTIYVFYGIKQKSIHKMHMILYEMDHNVHVWCPCYNASMKEKRLNLPLFPNYVFVFTMLPKDEIRKFMNVDLIQFYKSLIGETETYRWRRNELLEFYRNGGIDTKIISLDDIKKLI